MGERFEGRVVHETPHRIPAAIRNTYVGVGAVLVLLELGGLYLRVVLPISVAWLSAWIVIIVLIRRFAKTPKRRSVHLRIDDEDIYADDEVILRRRHLLSGARYVVANGDVRVVFRRRSLVPRLGGESVVVFIADHAVQADAILAAAGADVERQAFRAAFLRPHALWQAVLGLAIYVGLRVASEVLWRIVDFPWNPVLAATPVLVAGAVAFGVYALVARIVITVGNDGIEIRRNLRKTFVRMDEIRDVKAEKNVLIITRTNGERISLARGAPIVEPIGDFGTADIAMERGLLADRIADAMRLHRRRSQGGGALVALGRAGRSRDEWFASLRAIGAGAIDYRTNVVPVEELRRVVTDTAAASDVRIGAAVALRVGDAAGAAERIRVASDATAAPELRMLLKDIADADDDEQIQRHLQRIE